MLGYWLKGKGVGRRVEKLSVQENTKKIGLDSVGSGKPHFRGIIALVSLALCVRLNYLGLEFVKKFTSILCNHILV